MELSTKEKISIAIKKRWAERDKYNLHGHPITNEHKEKLRRSIKEKWKNGSYNNLINCELPKKQKDKISISIKQKWTDEQYAKRNKKALVEYWNDEDKRKEYSESACNLWKNESYRLKTLEGIRHTTSNPLYKEIMRQHGIRRSNEIGQFFKKLWQDPEYRQRHKIKQSLAMTDEIRKKLSVNSKNFWLNPIYRLNGEKHLANQLKNPKLLEAIRTFSKTIEYRKKMSATIQNVWKKTDYRLKMAEARLKQSKTSSQQTILYSLLDDLGIKYYKDNDEKCMIGYYCFDCLIELQNMRPLLIEVQGDYWHNLPKGIRNDKSKSTYLKTYFPEYDLKYIWEHEFNNKDRVIDLLKYWFGIKQYEINDVDFNKITERLVDYKEAELFISKYHYAGRIGNSGVNIGYYIDNILIAVCIYSSVTRQETAIKQGYSNKEVLELSRFCIHPQYQVKNLASNLISKSINYIKQNKLVIKCLISFADTTHNHIGIIYKASNWIFDGEVAPDYWYADDRGYICHKKTLWDKASKMSMTESEYCIKFNYFKIWGGKKFRYVYRLTKN